MMRRRFELEDVENGYRLNMYEDLHVRKENYERFVDAFDRARTFMGYTRNYQLIDDGTTSSTMD